MGVAFQLRAVGGDLGRYNMAGVGHAENCHVVYRIVVAAASPFGLDVVRVGNTSQGCHAALVQCCVHCCRNVVAVLDVGKN